MWLFWVAAIIYNVSREMLLPVLNHLQETCSASVWYLMALTLSTYGTKGSTMIVKQCCADVVHYIYVF